jgi:hypothetical protein
MHLQNYVEGANCNAAIARQSAKRRNNRLGAISVYGRARPVRVRMK